MPAIERDLADALVDWRAQQALGTEYAPITDVIDALQHHLDREMALRATIGKLVADVVEATGGDAA